MRPTLLPPILRRDALKGSVKLQKERLAKSAGPRQLGVGVPGGTEATVFSINVATALHEGRAVVPLDTAAAFQSVWRKEAVAATAEETPDFAAVLAKWYDEPVAH